MKAVHEGGIPNRDINSLDAIPKEKGWHYTLASAVSPYRGFASEVEYFARIGYELVDGMEGLLSNPGMRVMRVKQEWKDKWNADAVRDIKDALNETGNLDDIATDEIRVSDNSVVEGDHVLVGSGDFKRGPGRPKKSSTTESYDE